MHSSKSKVESPDLSAQESMLNEMEWPTVLDDNTGGKASRIGKLPISRSYRDSRMERITPIRICRMESGGPWMAITDLS